MTGPLIPFFEVTIFQKDVLKITNNTKTKLWVGVFPVKPNRKLREIAVVAPLSFLILEQNIEPSQLYFRLEKE